MHLTVRNINDAFQQLVASFHFHMLDDLHEGPSRNGRVITYQQPLALTYCYPYERVLFNEVRDCNPFFHVAECIWMLAGRNDIAFLTPFVKRMKDYADDGKTMHGAYGHRWREWFDFDQLDWCVSELRKDPDTRRVVLSMWDATEDPEKASGGGKDVPCNTHVYFRTVYYDGNPHQPHLAMTVCNRSNDLIWGTLGANVVHMSFLQEWLAAMVSMEVGPYHQISNNTHVYLDNWSPMAWLQGTKEDDTRQYPTTLPVALHTDQAETLRQECEAFADENGTGSYVSPWLQKVAKPMFEAHAAHKQRDYSKATKACERILAQDWRRAASEWVYRRLTAWSNRANSKGESDG